MKKRKAATTDPKIAYNESRILLSDLIDNYPEISNSPITEIVSDARINNALGKARISTIRDLSRTSANRLLMIRNFGIICINHLTQAISHFIEEFKKLESYDDFIQQKKSLRQLIDYSLSELADVQKYVILKRYGLWDGVGETLEEIGHSFKLTRERIRQIQTRALSLLRQIATKKMIKLFLANITNKYLIKMFNKNSGICKIDNTLEYLFNGGISELGSKSEVEIAYAYISDVYYDGEPFFTEGLERIEDNIYVVNGGIKASYELIRNLMVKYLRRLGKPTEMGLIIDWLQSKEYVAKSSQDSNIIEAVLSSTNYIYVDRHSLVGLREWPSYEPHTIKDLVTKILFEIGEPTHYTQISMIIKDKYPEYGHLSDRNVHVVLQGYKELFTWVSPGVYGLNRWGIKRSPYIKNYLIELFKNNKRPLNYQYLRDEVLKVSKCKEISIRATLETFSDVFVRYSKNLYGLKEWE